MRAYKGFHRDLTCTLGKGRYQYREGVWIDETWAECGRAGLHCAPSAHKKFGTLPGGTVRLAPSLFTSRAEVAETCRILRACAASGGRQGVK